LELWSQVTFPTSEVAHRELKFATQTHRAAVTDIAPIFRTHRERREYRSARRGGVPARVFGTDGVHSLLLTLAARG